MSVNTKASLDGLMKDVYGDKLVSLIPDFGILTKRIPFATAKKTGRDFVRPAKLTNEQGFSYGAGYASLGGAIASAVDDAKVRGSAFYLQTGFSYDAAANMASDKGAFIDATRYKFMAMMEAATFRLEQQMLYGGSGLGIVSSATDASDYITITDASWSVGTWAGQEAAQIDIYDTTGATLRVSTAITQIDAANKRVYVTAGTDLSTVVSTDVVWFKGAKGNEMTGLRSIASSTGSLYGISGSSYSLWTGNSYAVGSANLTLKKIYQGLINPVGKGLMEAVDVLVSPATFATLANDQASLRQYNTAPTTAENGVETIKFHGVNGPINVIVHPLVREGEAIAFPTKQAERIGASDLSFKTPGMASDDMFLHAPNNAGYECRLYSEQAIFLPVPGKCVLFTGVVNT